MMCIIAVWTVTRLDILWPATFIIWWSSKKRYIFFVEKKILFLKNMSLKKKKGPISIMPAKLSMVLIIKNGTNKKSELLSRNFWKKEKKYRKIWQKENSTFMISNLPRNFNPKISDKWSAINLPRKFLSSKISSQNKEIMISKLPLNKKAILNTQKLKESSRIVTHWRN